MMTINPEENNWPLSGGTIYGHYINPLGAIHYNHQKLISELMPVAKLELPKDLFLYIDLKGNENEKKK
jgi:hypothetical protein